MKKATVAVAFTRRVGLESRKTGTGHDPLINSHILEFSIFRDGILIGKTNGKNH